MNEPVSHPLKEFIDEQQRKSDLMALTKGPGWCEECRWDFGVVPHPKNHGPVQPNSPEERSWYAHGGRFHFCMPDCSAARAVELHQARLEGARLMQAAAAKAARDCHERNKYDGEGEDCSDIAAADIEALKPEEIVKP